MRCKIRTRGVAIACLILLLSITLSVYADEPVYNAFGGVQIEDTGKGKKPFVVNKEAAKRLVGEWIMAHKASGITIGEPWLVKFIIEKTVARPEERALVTEPSYIYVWDIPLYSKANKLMKLIRVDPYTAQVSEAPISSIPLTMSTIGDWAKEHLKKTIFGRTHPDAELVRTWFVAERKVFGVEFRSQIALWELPTGQLPPSISGSRYIQWFSVLGEPLDYIEEPYVPGMDMPLGESETASPDLTKVKSQKTTTINTGLGILVGAIVLIIALAFTRQLRSKV